MNLETQKVRKFKSLQHFESYRWENVGWRELTTTITIMEYPNFKNLEIEKDNVPARSFNIPITPKIVWILGTRSELQCGISSGKQKLIQSHYPEKYKPLKRKEIVFKKTS